MEEKNLKEMINSNAGIEEWKKAGFNDLQALEITMGMSSGVDVSIYAVKEYNERQMKTIRNALEEGVDVTPFASTEYDYMQMEQIKEGIKEGENRFARLIQLLERDSRYSDISKAADNPAIRSRLYRKYGL